MSGLSDHIGPRSNLRRLYQWDSMRAVKCPDNICAQHLRAITE